MTAAEDLPTVEEMRQNAYRLLGDAADELRSDWLEGTGPTSEQVDGWHDSQQLIAQAKAALNRAAR